VLGTSSGTLLVYQDNQLRASFPLGYSNTENISVNGSLGGVYAVAQRGRGFVAAGSRGELCVFEAPENGTGKW
jgi:hypothetical protein